MPALRGAFTIAAIVVTVVTVFFGSSFLVAFLMFDVFRVSNDQADFGDLAVEVIPFVVPPACALVAGLLVARKLRPKPDDERGFAVIPKERASDVSGASDAGPN